MKKLKILKINNGKYDLKDDKNFEYQIYINFYDMEFDLIIDDIIYISDELLKEKILSFGELNSNYGRELNFNNNVDIIMIKHREKKIYLKRLYG